jgi:uncharacterized cupin superfamily protein
MRRFNLHRADYTYEDKPDGYRCGTQRFGPLVGASKISGTVYEGTPTLRHPDGEDELEPGDLVCFREGPAGAHKVTNHTGETARVMIISTYSRPAIAIYPDSDKVGVWSTEGPEGLYRRETTVEYYDGEA